VSPAGVPAMDHALAGAAVGGPRAPHPHGRAPPEARLDGAAADVVLPAERADPDGAATTRADAADPGLHPRGATLARRDVVAAAAGAAGPTPPAPARLHDPPAGPTSAAQRRAVDRSARSSLPAPADAGDRVAPRLTQRVFTSDATRRRDALEWLEQQVQLFGVPDVLLARQRAALVKPNTLAVYAGLLQSLCAHVNDAPIGAPWLVLAPEAVHLALERMRLSHSAILQTLSALTTLMPLLDSAVAATLMASPLVQSWRQRAARAAGTHTGPATVVSLTALQRGLVEAARAQFTLGHTRAAARMRCVFALRAGTFGRSDCVGQAVGVLDRARVCARPCNVHLMVLAGSYPA
jgi:hypothetical protein